MDPSQMTLEQVRERIKKKASDLKSKPTAPKMNAIVDSTVSHLQRKEKETQKKGKKLPPVPILKKSD